MKKTFYISGMHCVSCEMLIEKEAKDIFKEAKIKVSHKSGELEIEADEINEDKIKEIVKKCGYKIIDSDKKEQTETAKKFDSQDLIEVVLAFTIVLFLFSMFSKFDLLNLFPDIGSDIGLFVALVVGIVASLSTCLVITGGIVISFSSQYKVEASTKEDKNSLFWKRSLPQIYFHAGRIGGFFVLGGLLGALGGAIQYSQGFTSFLTILVSFIMLYIGLNILGFLPNITKLGFYLPKKWSRGILNLQGNSKPLFIASIGVLTFFLPCGFTQSMQLAAVASGSFLRGALIMTFFAIGTAPVLFSVGLGSSYAQSKKLGLIKKIIAAIIILFALYSINSGLVVSGSRFSLDFWSRFINKTEAVSDNQKIINNKDYQTVQLDIDYTFKQKEFRIKKNVPVKFVVNPIRVTGCSDEVIISRLKLSTGKLTNGEKVVLEFTPTESGVIPFSCWMGMISGRFIVE